MIKRILDILFPINDWIPIHVTQARWVAESDVVTGKAIYEIMYSESRNSYKLVCSGTSPKKHQYYPYAVKDFYRIYYNYRQGTRLIGEVYELLEKVK